jgi:hypothetical protein
MTIAYLPGLTFPIQADADARKPATVIPWWLAEEAYTQYASMMGTAQTLERLAERGGFGRKELLDLLAGGRGDGAEIDRVRARRRR